MQTTRHGTPSLLTRKCLLHHDHLARLLSLGVLELERVHRLLLAGAETRLGVLASNINRHRERRAALGGL